MSKKVVLIGHCGPDTSYLRMAVKSALGDVTILAADDDSELRKLLAAGADLVLVNRQLDYGFASESGVDLITQLRASYPGVRTMLVSNYPEAQAEAVAAGALPGFGKREIGSPRVKEILRQGVHVET
jgi:two-component system, chemotaxis family, chemotaxis protein CheY